MLQCRVYGDQLTGQWAPAPRKNPDAAGVELNPITAITQYGYTAPQLQSDGYQAAAGYEVCVGPSRDDDGTAFTASGSGTCTGGRQTGVNDGSGMVSSFDCTSCADGYLQFQSSAPCNYDSGDGSVGVKCVYFYCTTPGSGALSPGCPKAGGGLVAILMTYLVIIIIFAVVLPCGSWIVAYCCCVKPKQEQGYEMQGASWAIACGLFWCGMVCSGVWCCFFIPFVMYNNETCWKRPPGNGNCGQPSGCGGGGGCQVIRRTGDVLDGNE